MQKVSLAACIEHFKRLNILNHNDETLDHDFEIDRSKISDQKFELNSSITKEEVLKSIGQLKQSKVCSSDLSLNNFLKYSKSKMLTAFTRLFNIVFSLGIIPDD